MRKDVYIVNDAGSWSVIAAEAVERIIADDREQDDQFVQAFETALFAIEGDDYSVIRIVTNEPLTAAESAEWIARARWRLKTGDGKLLITGGFDPDCLADWQEAGESDSVKEITVPPGEYQVVFYSYLHSMNGAVWLHGFPQGPSFPNLLSWFQQDYPGQPLPTWAVTMLEDGDLEDSDLADAATNRSIAEAVKSGELPIQQEPVYWVGYLIHLIPFESEMQLDSPEFGWFDPRTGLRRPSKCPLGISTDCTEDRQIQRTLQGLLE